MNKKILIITRTALLLALLVGLQFLTKSFGQLVTGSCVNMVLAVAALTVGMGSGVAVALVSPVLAFLLGIAPQILTVPAIMAGNTVFVVLLALIAGGDKKPLQRIAGWLAAAAAKCAVLYLLVRWVLCGLLAAPLLAAGALKPPMLEALPAAFGLVQLATALIGGALALLVAAALRKALHR